MFNDCKEKSIRRSLTFLLPPWCVNRALSQRWAIKEGWLNHLPLGPMKSVVPRDLPNLFLVCMAIMASRFSTDGRNEIHVSFIIRSIKSLPISHLMQMTESSILGNDEQTHAHTHTRGLCLHLNAVYYHWSAALSPQGCTWMNGLQSGGFPDMLLGDGRAPSSHLLPSCVTLYACFCWVIRCQRSVCLLSRGKPSPKDLLNITSIAFIHLQPSLFSLNSYIYFVQMHRMPIPILLKSW